MLAGACSPADAATERTTSSSTASKKKRAKTTAKKKKKRASTKKRASKKKYASKSKRKKSRRGTRSAKQLAKVKTTSKPLVKVATLQADGRVRYGADRMPPGFAWPPTKEMRAVGKSCEQALDELGVAWKPAAPEGMIAAPIVVPSMELGGIKYTAVYRRAPHTMDCQFAQTLALIGPELHALGVREVQFGSLYRNTMARSHGKTKTFRSRHALGIAMDIKAFVDASGRVAVVEMEYLKGDPLLHAIEDTINKDTRFRQVLTPGNDPISHDDHFHIEASVDFTALR